MERFRRQENACPICKGYDSEKRGAGERCYGYRSSDGEYAHCTRSELAGGMPVHNGKNGGETYAHRLHGPCRCGVEHGAAKASPRPIDSAPSRIVATYDYVTEYGELIYQVLRMQPKTFRQRRPDGNNGWIWNLQGIEPLIYRLPEVIAAAEAGDPVYVCEGEKDVHALESRDLVATCNSGGAGKFPIGMARFFRGAEVVIVRDKDEPGMKHADDVAKKLKSFAKSVRIVQARTGHDAHDHVTAGHTADELVPVELGEDLRASDPLTWKRAILSASLDTGAPMMPQSMPELIDEGRPSAPAWPSGLKGEPILHKLQGLTIVSGGPGAAKSYLAIASSIDAAEAGWEVFYLSAEMSSNVLARRTLAYLGHMPPPSWHLIEIGFGVSLEHLIAHLAEKMTALKTLIVFDSLSSFVDQGIAAAKASDPFGMGALKRIVMWMVNVRRRSEGQISFLALSELSKSGRTYGGFGDHKADLVLSMRSDEAQNTLKHVEVLKGWSAQVGRVGGFELEWERARLVKQGA